MSESGIQIPELLLTQETIKNLILFAREEIPMLLIGETGTGKTTLARRIHTMSERNEGPFVVVNAANLKGNTLESTLFGHVKGAYTGANYQRRGLLGAANKGTLFLDDAQAIEMGTQERLLRVMETGKFRPLGDDFEKETDARLIASFNKDPATLHREGKLHLDFVSRLASTCTRLPALREMPEQFEYAASCIMTQLEIPQEALSEEAVEILRKHPFMGNFRELKAVLQSAYILAGRQRIEQEHATAALRNSVTNLIGLTTEQEEGGKKEEVDPKEAKLSPIDIPEEENEEQDTIAFRGIETLEELNDRFHLTRMRFLIYAGRTKGAEETGISLTTQNRILQRGRRIEAASKLEEKQLPKRRFSPEKVEQVLTVLENEDGKFKAVAEKMGITYQFLGILLNKAAENEGQKSRLRSIISNLLKKNKTLTGAAKEAQLSTSTLNTYRIMCGLNKKGDVIEG